MASTPVEMPRCRKRGFFAIKMSIAGMLASPGAAIMGAKGKMRHDPNAHWRVAKALVLAIPAVAVLFIPD